jgi:hypothetical protein
MNILDRKVQRGRLTVTPMVSSLNPDGAFLYEGFTGVLRLKAFFPDPFFDFLKG